MDQILRNTGAQLEVTFYADETATAADGAVTVTVTTAAGTVIATGAATTSPSTGRYRYILDPQTDLDRLTLTWTGTFSGVVQSLTTQAEVVGGFYVALAEIREQPGLDNITRYTTAEMAKARRWFEEKFELYTGVAWVPRYRRERLNGNGRTSLMLPDYDIRTIRSVRAYSNASTFTEYTAAELADITFAESGIVTRATLGSWTSGVNNLIVEYECGRDAPVPSDVREAALVAIRDKLLSDQIGSRQYSVVTELGNVRFVLAGEGRPFGIPFVDQVANERRQFVPAIA